MVDSTNANEAHGASDAAGPARAVPVAGLAAAKKLRARPRAMTWQEMTMSLAFLAAAVGLVLHGERDVGSMLLAAILGGHSVSVGVAKRG